LNVQFIIERRLYRDMGLNRLHERLAEYGFTKEEAETYVFLAAMGPTSAGTVAKRFNYNRMKAYRLLNNLEEEGLVHSIVGRPVRYVVAPIEDIVSNRIEEASKRLSELQNSQSMLIEEIGKLERSERREDEEPRFRMYQGRQRVYELLASMCDRAENELRLITTPQDLLRLSLWGFEERFSQLTGTGKNVYLLTTVNEANLHEIEELSGSIDVRHMAIPTAIRFALIDEEETLSSVAMDDSMSMTTQNDTGLWTNSQSFVSTMKTFYDALWSMAPEASTVINTILTGERPYEFITIRSFGEYSETFREMLERSTQSVDIIVKSIQDLPATVPKHESGKRVRVLTGVIESDSEELSSVMKYCEVKDPEATTDLSLLIVDGEETLLATSGKDLKGQAIWSNLDSYVDTMKVVFEGYWRGGKPAQEIYREVVERHNYEEVLDLVKELLAENGLSVRMGAAIRGASGVEYFFNMVFNDPSDPVKLFGLNLVIGDDVFSQVFELSARKMDIKARVVLASIKPLPEEVVSLGKLYGITLIQSDTAIGLVEKLLESL
jgi:sugar-specific transcriptional regulator TrmB